MTEVIGPRYRVMLAVLYHCGASVGIMLVTAVSYVIRRWDYMFLASVLPLIGMLMYIWYGIRPQGTKYIVHVC